MEDDRERAGLDTHLRREMAPRHHRQADSETCWWSAVASL